ncbi:MAG: hypothetical protein P8Y94_04070 [Acidobacteriota bacterium]|jgi:hypothetical protein
MPPVTGSLTLEYGATFYTLFMSHDGWVVADLLEYLDDVYRAKDPKIGILKLLGYTMIISEEAPPRTAVHWIEVDVESHTLATNSQVVRKAVKQEPAAVDDPFRQPVLDRIYATLDRLDFTVELVG